MTAQRLADAPAATRRERMRATTLSEIKDVARSHVTSFGAANLSLRAIARELGMSAPALYRYYDSRDALLNDLLVDCFVSLAETIEAARDGQPEGDLAGRLSAAALAYRDWSLRHPAEFTLVFGAPIPGYQAPQDGPGDEAGERFGRVFLELVVQAWSERRFRVDHDLEPDLAASLQARRAEYGLPADVPLGVLALWLQGWGHLHGLISLEVFGHLEWVVPTGTGLYHAQLRMLLDRLELPHPGWLPR